MEEFNLKNVEKLLAFGQQGLDKFMAAFYGLVDQIDLPEVRAVGDKVIRYMNPNLPAEYPTSNWPMARFDQAVVVVGAYLAFTILGSAIMMLIFGRQTAPTVQRSVISKFFHEPLTVLQLIYNPLQVALCYYMIKAAIEEYQKQNYDFICNPMHYSKTGMAAVVWVFYMSKIFDFMDTVFIVLRRKWKQLSFLHVFHHCTIFMFYWLNINAGYDGDIYYTVVLNSFIHLVMYSYYFCTTLNVPLPGFVKPLVTNLQMLQFVTMLIQAAYEITQDCPYPQRITIGYSIYIAYLLALFLNFYIQSYIKGDKNKDKKKKKTQ